MKIRKWNLRVAKKDKLKDIGIWEKIYVATKCDKINWHGIHVQSLTELNPL